jgi:hypothetical protein
MNKMKKITAILVLIFIFLTVVSFERTTNKQFSQIDPKLEATVKLENDISEHLLNYPETKMSSYEIARVCIEYNIEPLFLLAQAHLESHYGTRGIARKNNSPFGINKTYDNIDASIEDYAILIRNNYLIDEKTIYHLLDSNCFVSESGHRYAKDTIYEHKIKYMMNYIKENSNIQELNYYYY